MALARPVTQSALRPAFLPGVPVSAAPRVLAARSLSARGPAVAAPRARPMTIPLRRVCAATAGRDDQPRSLTGVLPASAEALLLVNTVPFLWGTYTPLIKVLTNLNPHAPLLVLNFLFALTGSATMLGIRAVAGRANKDKAEKKEEKEEETPFGVSLELGVYLALGAIFHLASFSYTTPSRASFLVQLTSLFVPLIDWLTGAKLTRSIAAAASVTVLGAAVLAGPADIVNAAHAADASTTLFSSIRSGDIIAVISAFFYSLQIVRTDRNAHRSGNPLSLCEGTLRVQSLCAGTFALGAALTGSISLGPWLSELQQLAPHDLAASALSLLWIGGVTSAVSLWAQVLAQERVGASRASIFFAAQPVWSVGLAVAAGFDTLSSTELVGGALIVLGGFLLAAAGELETT